MSPYLFNASFPTVYSSKIAEVRIAGKKRRQRDLTHILLMWKIWRAPNNASKWQMGFNTVFKGLMRVLMFVCPKAIEKM
jgi:hypothetical protein